MPLDFSKYGVLDFSEHAVPVDEDESKPMFTDLSGGMPLRITQPTTIPRLGPTSTISGGPRLAVDFNTDFRGPTQTLSDALSEAYGIGTGSPSESLLGIRPEVIPSGQKITEETGIPRLLTVPASAIAKAGAGLGQFLTSVGGGVEVGTAGIPGVGLLQKAKWIYDMAKGAGESTGDLSAKLEMAAKNPEGMKGEDWQTIADDAANSALMLYGSGKLSSHEFSKLTGVRAPLGRMLESEKTRFSKDLAEELKKSEFTPTEQTAESIRRLGANVPIGPFAQPGVLELADAALAERMNPIVVPGRENAALNALRRAVEPPQIVPVTTARAERVAGGGEAPYEKVSYMREAEAPLPESAQVVPTTPPVAQTEIVIQPEPPEVEAKPEVVAETAPVEAPVIAPSLVDPWKMSKDQLVARGYHPTYLQDGTLIQILDKDGNELPKTTAPEPAKPPLSEPPVAEKIAASALQTEDGTIFTGAIHAEAFSKIPKELQDNYSDLINSGKIKSGFLTSSGRFITKQDALPIAKQADQITPSAQKLIRETSKKSLDAADLKPASIPVAKSQPAAAKVETPAAKVETEVKPSPKWTMTFEQFLNAPREGEFLDALRTVPKEPLSPERLAAKERYDKAAEAIEKAGLSWIYDRTDPKAEANINAALRRLPKAKQKLVKEYEDALKATTTRTPEEQRAGQQKLYDKAVAAGIIAKPATPEPIGGEPGPGLIIGTAIDKWADDVLRGGATHLAPEVFAAYLVRGASLIELGIRDFAAWSAKMVEMYGPAIEPHLKSIFDAAGNTLKRAPITESGTLKSARQIVEQRLGMASAVQSTPQAQISPQPQATPTTATAATTPTATPPSRAGTPATTVPSGAGLDDIYRIFEPEKKPSTPLRQRASNIIESFRTGFSSKFRPVNKLAEDIAKAYGMRTRKDIAGIMEQLKGSRGKGEADIYRFDRAVSDLVKGQEKDFNAYMFLRRSLDRLRQDQNDPNKRRAVAGYTIPVLEAKLATLEGKLGNDLPRFQQAADAYQTHLDNALRLQVESGRMSQEVYNQIKSENQFYAPFKVMKWLEEGMRPEGTGRKVDTVADYTKAMEGIEDPDFKLGDMLAAGRQNILISRILADKAVAMRHVADLANIDTQGLFIRKLFPTQEVARGWNAINVFENGKKTRYAVRPEVADALQLYGTNADGFLIRFMGALSVPFKAGATALNIPFQVSNLLADVPRQALVSKYGIRRVDDLVRYPMDFVHSLYSSMLGDMVGAKNKLFLDFLDSGAAQTTIQEHLTPQALRYRDPATMSRAKRIGLGILYTPAEFAAAIEQTSKILGVKRAMRFEGVGSGKELAKQIPDAVTEIRRFSGSPDFGRQGKWTETARLNLLYMFLNARIQGAVADVGRLTGRDGWKRAAVTWIRVGSAIGIPTAYLYALNNSPEYKSDYDKIPQQNKDNYWHIPKETFITNEDGEKMRDYWRIPKRESAKWIANIGESAMDFAQKRNPQAFVNFAQQLLEDISPVNIQGNTAQERLESVASGLNPVIKGPLEVATGREMYRHRDLVPDTMKKASPEMQFTDRTSEAFKKLAVAMPDVAFEFLRSPVVLENITRNLTAGLITQFLGGKPVEGRSEFANLPLLQRFQRTPYTDNEAFTKEIQGLERESADEYLTRHRTATDIMQKNKGTPLARLVKIAGKDRDMKLMQQVVDLWSAERNGATRQDRQLIALAPKQRAEYLAKLFSGMTPEAKRKAIVDLAKKRVLTEAVFVELPNAIKQLRKD